MNMMHQTANQWGDRFTAQCYWGVSRNKSRLSLAHGFNIQDKYNKVGRKCEECVKFSECDETREMRFLSGL